MDDWASLLSCCDSWLTISAAIGISLAFVLLKTKIHTPDLVAAPSLLTINRTAADVDGKTKKYAKLHDAGGGTRQDRVDNAQTMTNYYYDLATDFYEFGWSESFHFAPRWRGESFAASLVRHEWYLASRVRLAPGDLCLDVGCGVGGPMRNIARFSKARVTGINNNEYQLKRVAAKLQAEGLFGQCAGVKGDFMAMPFPQSTFDGAYAIEATVHAPTLAGVYAEIFRVLKPGKLFCVYEWLMTEKYDPKNPAHVAMKQGIELGNSLPEIRNAADVRLALSQVGFELMDDEDLALNSDVDWYDKFAPKCSLSGFKTTPLGIKVTHTAVRALEALRLAPPGSASMHGILITAGMSLYQAGVAGIFTPMHLFVARKPVNAQ